MAIEMHPMDSAGPASVTQEVRETEPTRSGRDLGQPVIVEAPAEIELDSLDDLARDLDAALREAGAERPVVIDLTVTRFVGMAGLALLLDSHARCVAQGTTLRLVCADSSVLRLLDVSGVAEAVPVDGARHESGPLVGA